MEHINILLGLFSGLALFLFGMEFMGDGIILNLKTPF